MQNVEVRFGTSLESCQIPSPDKPEEKAKVTLKGGEVIEADLVVRKERD